MRQGYFDNYASTEKKRSETKSTKIFANYASIDKKSDETKPIKI